MVDQQTFAGIHCVLCAFFFDADERPDRAEMALQVACVRAQGADGITVLGFAMPGCVRAEAWA